MKTKLECKNCTKRYPGCHDKCKNYKDWKQELDAINDCRKKENAMFAAYRARKKRHKA